MRKMFFNMMATLLVLFSTQWATQSYASSAARMRDETETPQERLIRKRAYYAGKFNPQKIGRYENHFNIAHTNKARDTSGVIAREAFFYGMRLLISDTETEADRFKKAKVAMALCSMGHRPHFLSSLSAKERNKELSNLPRTVSQLTKEISTQDLGDEKRKAKAIRDLRVSEFSFALRHGTALLAQRAQEDETDQQKSERKIRWLKYYWKELTVLQNQTKSYYVNALKAQLIIEYDFCPEGMQNPLSHARQLLKKRPNSCAEESTSSRNGSPQIPEPRVLTCRERMGAQLRERLIRRLPEIPEETSDREMPSLNEGSDNEEDDDEKHDSDGDTDMDFSSAPTSSPSENTSRTETDSRSDSDDDNLGVVQNRQKKRKGSQMSVTKPSHSDDDEMDESSSDTDSDDEPLLPPKPKKRKVTRWSTEEDDLLKELCSQKNPETGKSYTLDEASKVFQDHGFARTKRAIDHRRRNLKLSATLRAKPSAKWTSEELAFLREQAAIRKEQSRLGNLTLTIKNVRDELVRRFQHDRTEKAVSAKFGDIDQTLEVNTWSDDETRTLKKHLDEDTSYEEIAKLMGKPLQSIYKKAYRLRKKAGETKHRAAPRPWTEEEDQKLRELLTTINPETNKVYTSAEAAKELGRTKSSVNRRRLVLKIENGLWSAQEKKRVEELMQKHITQNTWSVRAAAKKISTILAAEGYTKRSEHAIGAKIHAFLKGKG